jgi:hypothetical protein
VDRSQIEVAIQRLLSARSANSSICPSEAARVIAPDNWRPLMSEVREAAAAMALRGEIRITQGETEIHPHDVQAGQVRGPIRLRRNTSS